MRRLIDELLRFGGVGLAATAVHAGVYALALGFVAPQAANVFGYLCAVCLSFFGHRAITFQGAGAARGQLWRFAAASVFGYALNAGFIAVATHILDAPPLGVWFILLVTPAITFVLLKFWVYRKD
ncbi:MAG: GtrA family protein [Pseudomonadota bacterium]